jgi:rhodanese-related sulfurtransferase
MSLKVSSTIGYERAHNSLLTEVDEDEFVRRSLAGLGPQPPNFQAIVGLNRGPLSSWDVNPHPLEPRQVEARRDAGALVADVRAEMQFDEAHVPGAVPLTTLRAGFGTRLAWMADGGREVVLIGRDDDDALEAARLAGSVGIFGAIGYLAGGMASWREAGLPVECVRRVAAADLPGLLADDPGIQVLDVREDAEWRAGHLRGSLHVPYHGLRDLPPGLDPERPVAAICGAGQRSAVAAGLLQALGAREVLHVVDGGVGTLEQLGLPMERDGSDDRR